MARIAFWTLVAPSRAELLDLIDKHHDRNAFDRAKTLAWTQAQVQLRHLDITADEAADFQRLAAPILYADPRFRPPSDSHRPRRRRPVRSVAARHLRRPADRAAAHRRRRGHRPGPPAAARARVLAHEAARASISSSSTSAPPPIVQDLQIAIETAVRSSQSRPRFGEELAQGSVYVLRADLMSAEARALLQSVGARRAGRPARDASPTSSRRSCRRRSSAAAAAARRPMPVPRAPRRRHRRSSSSSTGSAASTRTAAST